MKQIIQLFIIYLSLSQINATDKGLVGFFHSDKCPSGWIEADYVKHRTMIGRGSEQGFTDIGFKGGSRTFNLKQEQMPPHSHYIFNSGSTIQGHVHGNNYASSYASIYSQGHQLDNENFQYKIQGISQQKENLVPLVKDNQLNTYLLTQYYLHVQKQSMIMKYKRKKLS